MTNLSSDQRALLRAMPSMSEPARRLYAIADSIGHGYAMTARDAEFLRRAGLVDRYGDGLARHWSRTQAGDKALRGGA